MGLISACMPAAPMQSTRQLTALLTHCRGATAWAIGAVKPHLASWDGFCHRFSTVLNLCKHSPTPYLALSSFYCFLFFLSPTYSTDESSTLTIPIPDKKKKNHKQHLSSQNKSIFLPISSCKSTCNCQVSSAHCGRGNFSDSTSPRSIIRAYKGFQGKLDRDPLLFKSCSGR